MQDGIVKINSIAREAGIRSKVAVSSTNPDIDAAGSCIGPDGIRINSIRELVNGEELILFITKINLNYI